MTKFFVSGAFLLVLSGAARANDSAFSGVSGTPKPMKGEHRAIAMQSERIVIVADVKGYSTDVDFLFRNEGGKTSVQMGFPESSYGDVASTTKSAFLRFSSSVDGKKAVTRRIITSQGPDNMDAYWLKTVPFARHQTRRVHVSYRSPWGGNVEWGTHKALVYDFTGQNWKGKVERSDLEIRIASPGLWIGLPLFDYKPLKMALETTPKAAIFRKTWRNWQAQGNFTFGLTRTVPFWMLDRGTMSTSIVTAPNLKNAVTFRVGAVPNALPSGAEAPPAFIYDSAAYISLTHLKRRIDEWTKDSTMKWDAKTRISTLKVGAKTLQFSSATPVPGTSLRPVMLGSGEDSTLYVPLSPVAKMLGLTFKLDPKNRLFDLHRGSLLNN